jgi:hypothetical protein
MDRNSRALSLGTSPSSFFIDDHATLPYQDGKINACILIFEAQLPNWEKLARNHLKKWPRSTGVGF